MTPLRVGPAFARRGPRSRLMGLLQVIFWSCAGLVLYTYALYPAVVWFLSRAFGRAPQQPAARDGDLPTVTLLIAAHNEEAVIAERLDNALAADYPRDRYEVVVASDGSSDGTADIVGRYADRRVRLLDYKARRGK